MANNAEQKKTTPVTVENADVQKQKSSQPILLWIMLLILLLLGAGLYWLIEQQKLVMASIAAEVKTTQQTLEGRLSQLDSTVSLRASKTTQLLENLNSTDVGFARKIAEVTKVQEMTTDDVKQAWAMAEVAFLLQTASQRALLAKDNDGARTALGLADEKLKDLADPRLYRLRAILADEQLALSSVAKIDIDGMAVRLQSVLDKVDDIPILMAPDVAVRAEEDEMSSATPTDWKGALMAAWDEVRSLVVIRHQQDGSAAILVPEERYFLYQNLHLKLETARLALINGREAIYHDSLTSAEKWLLHYFTGEERDAVLATLKGLNSETITVTMPDISGSLVWLKEKGDQ